jgi:cell division protein FtsQ
MPGYDDELMPPRPAHRPVDNGIEFPMGWASERESAAQSRRQTAPRAASASGRAAKPAERQTQTGRSGRQNEKKRTRPPKRTNMQTKPGKKQRAAEETPLEPYPLPAGAGGERHRAADTRPAANSANAQKPRRVGGPGQGADDLMPWPTAPRSRNATPAAQEARRKNKITRATMRRRRLHRRLTAAALLLCVIAIGIFLTGTMFFKITAIEVRDADGVVSAQVGSYSDSQILAALGVQKDDNIFSFDPTRRAAQMEKLLPLLENIQIQRKYPGTVVVRATPATAVCATPTGAGWLEISASLKILSVESEQPALPVLYGGEPASTQPGDFLTYSAAEGGETDERMDTLMQLLEELTDKELVAGVTRLEYDDLSQIAFLYEDRISVLLGTVNELSYKMQFARYLLLNEDGKGCAPTDTGAVDCSHVRTDGTIRPTFAQGDPTLPSGYVCTQQAEEELPAAEDELESEEEGDGEGDAALTDEENDTEEDEFE